MDVAHDVGNAVFGLIGLVDLALDRTPIDDERAHLIRRAGADVGDGFKPLLAFARAGEDEGPGDLAAAARSAIDVYVHGRRKLLQLRTRIPEAAVPVACPAGLLLQAVVHVLLAADAGATTLAVDVADGVLSVAPAGAEESLHTVATARIAADRGGMLERAGGALRLRLPPR